MPPGKHGIIEVLAERAAETLAEQPRNMAGELAQVRALSTRERPLVEGLALEWVEC